MRDVSLAPLTLVPNAPRHRAGRPPTKDPASPELKHLINVARTKDHSAVAGWLQRKLNMHMDEELEVLATYVLGEAVFDVASLPEVMGPLGRGDKELAMAMLVSRMRRKFAKLLRDHKRGETDDFLDNVATQVD